MPLLLRVLAALAGVALAAVGSLRFLDGDEIVGGLVVVAGATLFTAALRRPREGLFEGLTSWIWWSGR